MLLVFHFRKGWSLQDAQPNVEADNHQDGTL